MTTRWLILHLEAPLMSFGRGVDQHGVTTAHPTLSALVGLLANALGWDHRDHDLTQRLQARVRYASRVDRGGETLQDYQTVDLGQPHLSVPGWTTRGVVVTRGGGFSDGTHIRFREYLADAAFTVALALDPPDEAPTIDDLHAALKRPERPLYLGRKPCLPSAPLVREDPVVEASDVLEALRLARRPGPPRPAPEGDRVVAYVPADEHAPGTEILRDRRDWQNQVFTGRRYVRRVTLLRERDHG
jgi:CRISPR system Cascade subunit CasD